MSHEYSNDTAFIRVEGEDIVEGQIDIQTALAMLNGTQTVIDYFLKKEDSSLVKLKNINYPIKTQEGSWEVLLQYGVEFVAQHGGTIIASAGTMLLAKPLSAGITEYAKEKGKGLASRHLERKHDKELFEKAFEKLLSIIKIAQHLGVVENRRVLNTKVINADKILLVNEKGNVLSTNLDEINSFQECPDKLLKSLASVVTDYRTLSIGYKKDDRIFEVAIDRDSREIFCPDEELQAPILPTLQDGEYVSIVGMVCRGNQITNTIGFQYEGHVITCEPNDKLITAYINAHYKKCEIIGKVIRTSAAEVALGKRDRPKIIFDELKVIMQSTSQASLFAPRDGS